MSTKLHSANYTDTFIEVAGDCLVSRGEVPPVKENTRTGANIQFGLVYHNPYKYTSGDVLFRFFAERNTLPFKDFNGNIWAIGTQKQE